MNCGELPLHFAGGGGCDGQLCAFQCRTCAWVNQCFGADNHVIRTRFGVSPPVT